ncbi:MAG: hypothetical protein KAS53_08800 [Candidatus Cloacimonetes bacterium]|nr:hypothetical protein [Candidatus Cloacimonadota bacterium]
MQNDKIEKLIKSEFELHPKAQLKDYYKLFFQGTFGPGHIISNRSSAREFLENELEESSIFEVIDYQNISYINEFYRVNLNVINKKIITFDDFLDAFLMSAKIENEISYKEWLINWENIEHQIFIMKIPIENIEEQSAELLELIRDKQLVGHSDIYRTNYSPHYRLISSEQFQRFGSFI